MNTYNINDQELINSKEFQEFKNQNPSYGFLRIRAFAASQAVPIIGLKIYVSKVIGDNKVIFFEGYTNESGVIENISLPAPFKDENDLDVPTYTTYDITATYENDNISLIYKVNIYEGLHVVQNINVIPTNFGGAV